MFPLAVAMSKIWPTAVFDVDAQRIAGLQSGVDHTLELSAEELALFNEFLASKFGIFANRGLPDPTWLI